VTDRLGDEMTFFFSIYLFLVFICNVKNKTTDKQSNGGGREKWKNRLFFFLS